MSDSLLDYTEPVVAASQVTVDACCTFSEELDLPISADEYLELARAEQQRLFTVIDAMPGELVVLLLELSALCSVVILDLLMVLCIEIYSNYISQFSVIF